MAVGEAVYVGARVTLLPGVTIPDRCTVGAGSVLTATLDVRCGEGAVIAGNPAAVREP